MALCSAAMAEPTYKRAIALMEAQVGDELVAMDVNIGSCFGFNSVAKDVWQRLGSPKTSAELRDELLADYDVDAERCAGELQALLDELVAKGWVERLL
jgi:hypothetical protein